tara:strand:- start:5557 stop:6342 length:786 start_codon:yes stop_codon:yes gene_type:complete
MTKSIFNYSLAFLITACVSSLFAATDDSIYKLNLGPKNKDMLTQTLSYYDKIECAANEQNKIVRQLCRNDKKMLTSFGYIESRKIPLRVSMAMAQPEKVPYLIYFKQGYNKQDNEFQLLQCMMLIDARRGGVEACHFQNNANIFSKDYKGINLTTSNINDILAGSENSTVDEPGAVATSIDINLKSLQSAGSIKSIRIYIETRFGSLVTTEKKRHHLTAKANEHGQFSVDYIDSYGRTQEADEKNLERLSAEILISLFKGI